MDKIKNRYKNVPVTVKSSVAYAICSILQRCLSFFTLPVFVRLLTTEQYGQVTIYQSWSGIIGIFLTLNLSYGSFSTAMVKFEKDRDGYISSVEGICIVLSLIFLIVYLPFSNLWNQLFELPTFIVCIMVAEIVGVTAIQLWSGKKRFEFKYKSVVIVTLLTSIVSPVFAYYLVINNEEKGYFRILGYVLVNLFIGFIFLILNIFKGKKIFNKSYWKYALGFNVPLLAYYLSQVIFNQSDRIMISHMLGKDKAAVYGVAYSLAMVLSFVLNAINNSYVPWFYGKIKENNQHENRKVSLFISGLMALLLLGVIWFAPEIIKLLAGEEYLEAVYVVSPVSISLLLLFYSQLFINVEFYFEEKKKLIWASIGAAITNLILNWLFIPLFGFVAAAYTTLVSYMLFAFFNYVAMKKVLKEKNIKDNSYNYTALIILFIVFGVIAIVGVCLYKYIIIRICVALFVSIVLLINSSRIINVYKTIKQK